MNSASINSKNTLSNEELTSMPYTVKKCNMAEKMKKPTSKKNSHDNVQGVSQRLVVWSSFFQITVFLKKIFERFAKGLIMNINSEKQRKSRRYSAAYSMIEIMIVVGIILVLTGAGTVGFLSTLKQNRVASAVQMVMAQMQQARQNAISMRQDRRVAINVGMLSDQDELSGERVERPSVWVEGKRCERFPFSGPAICQDENAPNNYQITDEATLPDGVTITLADSNTNSMPGLNSNPTLLYFEFNPRGQLSKVYYSGNEPAGEFNYQLPSVLHFFADNAQFETENGQKSYLDLVTSDSGNSSCFEFGRNSRDDDGDCALERYKVQTLEVVRLTGKTRRYEYGYQEPFPFDQPAIN